MKEYIVKNTKNNTKQQAICCGVFILIYMCNIYRGIRDYHIVSLIIGITGLLFFGFIFIRSIMTPWKQQLIINDSGVIDNTTFISVGLIPWNNINSVKKKRVFGQDYISLEIKDIDLLTRELSKRKKIGIRFNWMFFSKVPTVFLLVCKEYNYTCDEIMYLLKEKLNKVV